MKISKLPLLLIVLTVIALPALAQDYAFKVLVNKGVNEVKTGGTWQPVKIGATLKSDDELKLSENSYIGLVHAKGKPLEVKKAGTHSVADLAGQIGEGSSVMVKYADFVLSSNSAEAKKNKLSATGAVHRDISSNAPIQVFLPASQYAGVFNDAATIVWESEENGPYVVTVYNMFDEDIAKIETADKHLVLNLANPTYAGEPALKVEVQVKGKAGKKSDGKVIKRVSSEERKNLQSELKDFGIGDNSNALQLYLLAGFYEGHNLFIDALGVYETLLKLEPEVSAYQEAYQDFLVRNGIKK
jgi:hypothetical protein